MKTFVAGGLCTGVGSYCRFQLRLNIPWSDMGSLWLVYAIGIH